MDTHTVTPDHVSQWIKEQAEAKQAMLLLQVSVTCWQGNLRSLVQMAVRVTVVITRLFNLPSDVEWFSAHSLLMLNS
jgi:uncharacterized metal-binding protein YceD (DUF177 family)